MSYTVKCCATSTIGSAFYSFPTGCRVSGGSLTRRTNLVVIPYADGTKDTGDGKLGTGDTTVGGRIWAASGQATITLVKTMEAALLKYASAFFVVQDYGSSQKYYPVHCCTSVAHTMVDGAGGIWIDIDCVFARGPDPEMV